MTTSTTTRKIPTPLYAAAGAGDLAYEQLRKLPAQVAQLRARVEELRPAVAETNLRADLTVAADRLRNAARRNTTSLLAGAQVAQDRALAVYTDLVNRGEKVVAGGRTAEAKIEIAPATKTVTTEVAVTPTPADIAPAVTPVETDTPVPAKKVAAKKTAAAKK
ncbi:hypothetical protein AB0J72_47040 [Dactylosporangium sp. NPDC049742]|uniref:hypothetical protein n=1 Tax=unclassified Dactylosporangium TaxID=2621675 RepID=UPI0033D71511